MSEEKNLDTLLPCGERIKPLLIKSCISDTDLKNILARRGVFIGNNQKQNSIPLIAMSILSPKEFEGLQEKQKVKEDSIKVRTSRLKCDEQSSLVDMIPNDLIENSNLDIYDDCFEFDSDLSFGINDQNEMIVEYKIKRDNVTKDWASSQSTFEGRVILKKDEVAKKLEFLSEFTSDETRDINKEIVKNVRKHLILNNYIKKDEYLECITANSFSDENRFRFMLSLINDSPSGILEFQGIKNVEVGPIQNVKLPEDVKWMTQSVKNMIINGDSLENITFIQNDQYYSCLILREIEAKYKFNYAGARGSCIIEFGFPHYFRKNNNSKEFQFTIAYLSLDRECCNVNKKSVIRFLTEEFNLLKLEKYESMKK